jgi:hypothetical protein
MHEWYIAENCPDCVRSKKDGVIRCRRNGGVPVMEVPHCIIREAFTDQARYRQVCHLINNEQNLVDLFTKD